MEYKVAMVALIGPVTLDHGLPDSRNLCSAFHHARNVGTRFVSVPSCNLVA